MTPAEHRAETARLEALIAQEDAGKKSQTKTLAEKIEHNRLRNQYQEQLHNHKLNYFELVVE